MKPVNSLSSPRPSGSLRLPGSGANPSRAPWWLWLVVLCGLTWASPGFASGEARLRAYLQNLNSLSADFRQRTLHAEDGRLLESSGRLYLRRPGRFRWEYHQPAEQILIADGSRVWLHDLELDQVSHQSQDSALSGTPAQLLVNEGPIERDFALYSWDAGDGREWVELRPKDPESQIALIRIGFLQTELDTLLMEDRFGQITRFTFAKVRRNPRLDDRLFTFKPPIGGDFLEIR